MPQVTCKTGACPNAARCLELGICDMEEIPIVHDVSEPPREIKRIEDMSLDDYRRGVDRVMRSPWRMAALPPS